MSCVCDSVSRYCGARHCSWQQARRVISFRLPRLPSLMQLLCCASVLLVGTIADACFVGRRVHFAFNRAAILVTALGCVALRLLLGVMHLDALRDFAPRDICMSAQSCAANPGRCSTLQWAKEKFGLPSPPARVCLHGLSPSLSARDGRNRLLTLMPSRL